MDSLRDLLVDKAKPILHFVIDVQDARGDGAALRISTERQSKRVPILKAGLFSGGLERLFRPLLLFKRLHLRS